MNQVKLTVVPIALDEAQQFIRLHHRHHSPPVGHKFSVAVADPDNLVRGVATVGRPVSRHLDDGWTLEVNRVATDGCENACSALYGATWRIAREMGYRRLITYILSSGPGTSLRGAGWKCLGERGGGDWSRKGRPRVDTHPTQTKMLFEMVAK